MELLKRIKAGAEKKRAAIAEKVHPALPPMLRGYGEALNAVKAMGKNPPNELVMEIEARMVRELRKLAQEYPEVPISALALIHPDLPDPEKAVDEGKAIPEVLHFNRHLKPLKTDLDSANRGDKQALKRVHRTLQDVVTLHCAQGPLKPTKADLDHTNIFMFGWGMGLEKLTYEELAEFFDQNCWCGKCHDADALRKQARRIFKSPKSQAVEAGKEET